MLNRWEKSLLKAFRSGPFFFSLSWFNISMSTHFLSAEGDRESALPLLLRHPGDYGAGLPRQEPTSDSTLGPGQKTLTSFIQNA